MEALCKIQRNLLRNCADYVYSASRSHPAPPQAAAAARCDGHGTQPNWSPGLQPMPAPHFTAKKTSLQGSPGLTEPD